MADPIGIGLLAASTAISAAGTIAGGAAEASNYKFQAAQMEQRAGQERAIAQREANEERRQGDLAASRARAVGAASGGGVDFNRIGDIAMEGERNALMALYDGEERARGAEMDAASSRMSARNARTASYFSAAGTIARGASSMYEKYGG